MSLRTNTRRSLFLIVLLFCLLGGDANPDPVDPTTAKALCYDIERYVNALVDYTTTVCLPGEGSEKGSLSFIVLSEKPAFSSPEAKKAWLLVVAGVVGKLMNERPRISVGEVFVSDKNLMTKRIAYSFPGALAKTLQRKIKNDEITLDEFYRQLSASLKKQVIPERK